jgi:hypothetical protein
MHREWISCHLPYLRSLDCQIFAHTLIFVALRPKPWVGHRELYSYARTTLQRAHVGFLTRLRNREPRPFMGELLEHATEIFPYILARHRKRNLKARVSAYFFFFYCVCTISLDHVSRCGSPIYFRWAHDPRNREGEARFERKAAYQANST